MLSPVDSKSLTMFLHAPVWSTRTTRGETKVARRFRWHLGRFGIIPHQGSVS